MKRSVISLVRMPGKSKQEKAQEIQALLEAGTITSDDYEQAMHMMGLATEKDIQQATEELKRITQEEYDGMSPSEYNIIQSIRSGRDVRVEDMPTSPSDAFLRAMHQLTEERSQS